MKTFRTSILIIFLFTTFSNGIAQKDNFTAKNTVTLNASALLIHYDGFQMYGDLGLTYERIFISREKLQLGAHFQAGVYSINSLGAKISPRMLLLLGGGNHHFESTIGANLFIGDGLYRYIPTIPAASIGYRYQKPSGDFLFRMAVGYGGLAQIGIGYSF